MKFISLLLFVSFAFSGCAHKNPGSVYKEEIRTVIRASLPTITNCYEQRLEEKSNLAGKVVIAWEINDKGEVASAKLVSSTANDPTLETCVVSTVKSLKFPPAPLGKIVEVKAYPFIFNIDK